MARLSKEEVAAKMKDYGFDAYVNKGVVFVFVSEEEKGSHVMFEKLRGIFKEIGYNASWGFATKGEKDVRITD